MDYLIPVVTGVCLSACTGFRAFLPPFLVGLLLRFAPGFSPLFPGFHFLSQAPVLFSLGVAAAVEFVGDKIPWVDNLLDMLSLPVKTVITAIMTYSLIPSGEYKWFFLLMAMVLNQGATVTAHSGKSGIRAVSTVTTGGLANPVIGFIEDVSVAICTILAIVVPLLAAVLMVWILWQCVRYIFGGSGGNEGKVASTRPSNFSYAIVSRLSWIFFTIYNRMSVEGRENIPREGPLVIVANHAAALDGFILGSASSRPVHVMVKREGFDSPFSGWLLRKNLAFPVDRSRPDTGAVKNCLKILREGKVLGLFPEGTRNRKGLVRPFKPGAIRLAVKQKVRIIPGFIAGSHEMSPLGCFFPRPAKIKVAFEPAIDVPALLSQGKTEQEIQDFLYEQVTELGLRLTGRDVRDLTGSHPNNPGQE